MALTTPGDLPRVAIVGRPNVGKSTLFNRLTATRRAITDPTPGVTRDPIEQVAEVGGRRIVVVDTGGMIDGGDELETRVTARSVERARQADLILLVVDVMNLTPLDESFAAVLRPQADRIILVANKTDNEAREDLVWDHHRLGFPRVVAVSAVSGRNMEELEIAIAAGLPDAIEAPATDGPETRPTLCLAILGKPNTGKSTLLNRLLGEERSLVSDVPGTTRDVVEGVFETGGRLYRVLDTAGIRRKSSVSTSVEVFSVHRAIQSIESADVILLLIDSVDSVSDQDKKIASVAARRGRGIILCLNKWDRMPRTANTLNAVTDRVRFLFPVLHFAPILPLSAATGFGVDKILKTAGQIREQLDVRVPTAQLNRILARWMEAYPVPAHGKNIRIRFIAQKGLRPSTFVANVNTVKAFPKSYLRYLENKIREDFGLGLIPLHVEIEDS